MKIKNKLKGEKQLRSSKLRESCFKKTVGCLGK